MVTNLDNGARIKRGLLLLRS